MKWQAGILMGLLILLPMSVEGKTWDVDEVLQQMLDARNQVSFVGTRLVVDWLSPAYSMSREELVIQRPGAVEITRRLLPPEGADEGPPGGPESGAPRGEGRGLPPPPPRYPVKPLNTVAFLKHISLLKSNYEILISGGRAPEVGTLLTQPRTVAGRPTYMVQIRPKHPGRPAKKLWLDVEKHVPLRIQDYDPEGRLKSLLVYTEIDFQAQIDEEAFQHPEQAGGPRERASEALSLAEAQKRVHFPIRTPKFLPAGFVFEDARIITRGKKRHAHLHYTDGLSLLSLFETAADNANRQEMKPPGPPADEVRIGNVTCTVLPLDQMLVLRWNHRAPGSDTELSYTLIGDLRRDALVSIAESLILGE